MKRLLRDRDLHTISYKKIASLFWAYTSAKSSDNPAYSDFWNYLVGHVDEISQD
jgi:hypothetical protein